MRRAGKHKHLVLFLITVLMLALQPLVPQHLAGVVLHDVLTALIVVVAVLVVFEQRTPRLAALLGGGAIVASYAGAHLLGGNLRLAAATVYHALVAAFLGLAIVAIVRQVFRQKVIGGDAVLGSGVGYLLAGIAWGNLYALIDGLHPGSYSVSPGLSWQLANRNTRRFLFNYFSFCTLTSVGYGDVTPTSPTASWLACLEAVFGQFYIAVVVAQLVGMKLAQAVRTDEPMEKK
jgi:hypothetical protein